jgi:hypothetical protein
MDARGVVRFECRLIAVGMPDGKAAKRKISDFLVGK